MVYKMKSFNSREQQRTTQRTAEFYTLLNNCIPYLIFFTGSFIYFGFFGDYVLFFQEKSALFIFSADFLSQSFHQPGGLIIWLGELITTFFFHPLAGAFILAALLTLFIIIVRKTVRNLTGNDSIFLPFIFGLALFYLQTDYRFLVLNIAGMLLQIALFYISVKYLTMVKGWIPVFITPFWYFIAGGFSWIFVLLLILYFAFYRVISGWLKIIAVFSVLLLIIYISKEFLFFQSLKTLLLYPTNVQNTGFHPILFYSVVAIFCLIPLISKIKVKLPARFKISDSTVTIILSGFTVILLFVAGIAGYSKKDSQYFQVEKLFYQNKFDEVTTYLRANPSNNSLTMFLNNISLCEKGQLNDQLFNFPQSPDGSTLFLKWEIIGEVLRRGGYFYYTIGMINEAHRWAFENMVMKGLSPEDLKMLIKTELIYGNYKVASKYIAILKKTAFYNDDAKRFEKLLFDDLAVNADPDLGEKRKIRLNTDFFSITDDPIINIERILATDSLNKKTFQYKVAFLLLKKNYQGIANILPGFEKLGYTRFPQNFEEAAIALSVYNNGKLPYLGNIKISKSTELRWTQYLTVFQEYGTNPKTAEPALKRKFGNTFWYWVFYR
jgi:Family of unknown function (DUF6057)